MGVLTRNTEPLSIGDYVKWTLAGTKTHMVRGVAGKVMWISEDGQRARIKWTTGLLSNVWVGNVKPIPIEDMI